MSSGGYSKQRHVHCDLQSSAPVAVSKPKDVTEGPGGSTRSLLAMLKQLEEWNAGGEEHWIYLMIAGLRPTEFLGEEGVTQKSRCHSRGRCYAKNRPYVCVFGRDLGYAS